MGEKTTHALPARRRVSTSRGRPRILHNVYAFRRRPHATQEHTVSASSAPEPVENDLHARIRAGDPAAFESLFREYYARLSRFAARHTESAALAEELVQDLFTRLWIERDRWPAPANIRAYLFRAVRNRALNVLGRRQIEAEWVERERDAGEFASAPLVEDDISAGEAAEWLARAIERLSPRCRLVVHLRWMEQLSYAEIAEIMGISTKGVENQLARGMRALRADLRGRR